MPIFAYTARETATGREMRNTVEAATEQAAIAALLNRNLLVVEIREKTIKRGQTKGGKVSLNDLVVFTRQLATMIDAGIAIVQSLQALAEQTPNKIMRETIRDVCTRVESGESFSEALTRHPKAFNRLYVSMVSAGEKGGLLAEILARLATYLENAERLRKKVKTALMYPTVVSVVAVVITIFLLVRVIPTFKEVYSGFGAKLPAPTEVMITISEIVQHYLIYLIVLAGLGVWGWLAFLKTNQGPGLLGQAAHQAARLWAHRTQDLPGPLYPHPVFAHSQRRSHLGSSANCFPDRRQHRHGKGHQIRRQRHRTRRRHLRRAGQTSSLSEHDHPHVERRRTDRQY